VALALAAASVFLWHPFQNPPFGGFPCSFSNKSQHGLSPDMGGPFGRNGILIYVSTNHNAKVLKHTLPGIREDTPMK